MIKANISLTLDTCILDLIGNHPNRSALINDILKEKLMGEDGLASQIKEAEDYLSGLKKRALQLKESKDNFLDEVSEELKQALQPINNNGESSPGIKDIIADDPSKLNLWTEIMNKRFRKSYTPNQFSKIVKRWG